jgi:uncharacterized membrane protein
MYESKHQQPIARVSFVRRVAVHLGAAAVLVAISLAVGMAGYAYFERLGWIDAFLNAAMLLGGMGPVDAPKTPGGKLFAGCYALYAGLVFLITAALVFTPLLHRVLHRLHFDEKL